MSSPSHETSTEQLQDHYDFSRGSLEKQQSSRARHQRTADEGDEAVLTEVAGPPPAPEDDGFRDTYEEEEQKQKTTADPDGDGEDGRGSLEKQQSSRARHQRTADEGDEAVLTEVAGPPPAPEDDGFRDTYEEEEQKQKTTADPDGDGEDAALTELIAPEPVSRYSTKDEEAAGPDVLKSREEDVVSSTPNSSLTQVEKEGAAQGLGTTFLTHTELFIVSWIIFFSILGTLARLGVQAIATYPDTPFSSTVLWANLGGSFFLGFLMEDRRFFRYSVRVHNDSEDPDSQFHKAKKILPLYIGLATGFCGSFTSFSSFITDAFLALTNDLASPSPMSPYHTIAPAAITPRSGGYSLMATIGILIIQIAVSLASLKTGSHVALLLEPLSPGIPDAILRRVLDPVSVLLGWGCWLGAVLFCIWPPGQDWRYRAAFAVAFAPPGALSRFYLSKHLNARISSFPVGTFIVNVLGTIVEGMCMDLQHSSRIMALVTGANTVPCAVLQGIIFGFCGCVTTTSTWVAELGGLRRRHAWIYGLASVAVAMAFQVVIMGTMGWTVGFDQHCAVRAAWEHSDAHWFTV